MRNISRRFSRIFLSSRQTISRCWQDFSARTYFTEEEGVHATNSSESFGDGTRMLEILFAPNEPERMTIALSVQENDLFELVAVSIREEFSSREVASVR